MRRLIGIVLALFVLGGPIAFGLTKPETVPASALGTHTPNLENGRAMFLIGGCSSCHATRDQQDRTRLGGGRELPTRFGTFRVPNISPHAQDGIGRWTELQFVNALTKGTSPDGRHYYPSFPYTSYQRMRFTDVRDLFAYLMTLPAVPGRAAGHELPFPFYVRAGIGLWKLRYLDGRIFRPEAGRSEQWNRGAYLVDGPGHCAECHSPRDFLGAIVESQRHAGGPNPAGEGYVPNITQHQRGLVKWSEADIARLLATGEMPNGETVGGDMALVVRNTAQLPESDRAAMAHFVKQLPPVTGPAPPSQP